MTAFVYCFFLCVAASVAKGVDYSAKYHYTTGVELRQKHAYGLAYAEFSKAVKRLESEKMSTILQAEIMYQQAYTMYLGLDVESPFFSPEEADEQSSDMYWNLDLIIAELRECVRLDSAHSQGLMLLAKALSHTNRIPDTKEALGLAKALMHYRGEEFPTDQLIRYLESQPQDLIVDEIYAIGRKAFKLGDFHVAALQFTQAISHLDQHSSKLPTLYYSRATAYFELKHFQQALADIAVVKQFAHMRLAAEILRAKCYLEMGDKESLKRGAVKLSHLQREYEGKNVEFKGMNLVPQVRILLYKLNSKLAQKHPTMTPKASTGGSYHEYLENQQKGSSYPRRRTPMRHRSPQESMHKPTHRPKSSSKPPRQNKPQTSPPHKQQQARDDKGTSKSRPRPAPKSGGLEAKKYDIFKGIAQQKAIDCDFSKELELAMSIQEQGVTAIQEQKYKDGIAMFDEAITMYLGNENGFEDKCLLELVNIFKKKALPKTKKAYLILSIFLLERGIAESPKEKQVFPPLPGVQSEVDSELQHLAAAFINLHKTNHLTTLGLPADRKDQARAKYLKLVLQAHPDRVPEERKKGIMNLIFQQIDTAYKALSEESN